MRLWLASALSLAAPIVLAGQGPQPAILEANDLGGLRADVVALLATGTEGGAFRAAVIAVPRPGPARRVPVDVWVEVEGAGLLGDFEEECPNSLWPELYVYAIRADGGVEDYLSQTVSIDLAELGETLLAGGLKFQARLDLTPGNYNLRVLVREPRSQRFVLRILPLVVPGTKGPPVLLAPVFADPGTEWIRVRGGAELEEVSPEPAALPVLKTDREAAVSLTVCGHSGMPRLLARLLDGAGKTVAEPALRVAGRQRTSLRCERTDARFDLEGVATGNYFFEASLAGTESASTAHQVYVSAGNTEVLAWTGFGRRLAPSSEADLTLGGENARRAQRRREISAAYRKSIERLAQGGVTPALDGLAALEERAAGSVEAEVAGKLLGAAEGEVLTRLAKHDPEALIPILVLLLEAHERYLARSQTALAAFTRERLRDLGRLYREKTARRKESSRDLVAKGLALLGDSVMLTGMATVARSVYEDVLALDEHNASALIGMARTYERLGDYSAASGVLERLLTALPDDDEARLRMALCHARMDLADDAAVRLRHLIDHGKEPWVVVLAYQELARIYLDRRRFQAAAALLEESVRRYPSAERLYLALAYARDRGGDRRGADDALERAPHPKAETPRFTYGRRSQENREDVRAELMSAGLARLAVLQAALSATGEDS